jgi:hypothetical protein
MHPVLRRPSANPRAPAYRAAPALAPYAAIVSTYPANSSTPARRCSCTFRPIVAISAYGSPYDTRIPRYTGTTLRYVGDRDPRRLRAFLDAHAPTMPRATLRTATEKLPKSQRDRYLAAKPAAARR